MKHVRTHSELDSSTNKRKTKWDAKTEKIEMKGFGLVFDKITSMELEKLKLKYFTNRTFSELLINNHATLITKTFDKFCAVWSILAVLFPSKTNQDSRTNYKQHFNKLNTEGIVFSEGWRTEYTPNLDSQNSLNLIVIELRASNGKTKLLPP